MRDRTKGLLDDSHKDASGKIRSDLYRKSSKRHVEMKTTGDMQIDDVTWEQIGPAPARVNYYLAGNGQLAGPNAGGVMDLVIDPRGTFDQVVYAATSHGGIWKTSDSGNNWAPLTDMLQTTSFGSVALDPLYPDIVYAGTGNKFGNGYYTALGIYKSTNGGQNWALTGENTLKDIQIIKILIPQNDILLVATTNGLYRSTDGGGSYYQIEIDGANGGYITDIDMLEGDKNSIWVSVYNRGIYKTTDMGESVTTQIWPSSNDTPPRDAFYFISFAASANGQYLYMNADLEKDSEDDVSPGVMVWRSRNYGANWEDISAIANTDQPGIATWRQIKNCQCGYDQTLAVDPQDPNRVYMGFQDMWISTDGGDSWKDHTYSYDNNQPTVEQMHVDHHALIFSPPNHRSPSLAVPVWVGNDGGIWKSTDNGTVWHHKNDASGADQQLSFATNLMRHIDTGRGANNNGWTYGGMQDTGTGVQRPNDPDRSASELYWYEWSGGDGWAVAVDWDNPEYAYGMANKKTIYYTHHGGQNNNNADVTHNYGKCKYKVLETNPQNGYVYLGGKCDDYPTIFRSTNNGVNYTEYYRSTSNGKGYVKSIAVTPANANLIFASLPNGKIKKVVDNNGTPSTTSLYVNNTSAKYPPSLAVHQTDPDIIVAVYEGYNELTYPQSSKHVFLTTDGGNNWQDISGTTNNAYIDDMPIYAAVFDPNTSPYSIIVASDFGVYRTNDNGSNWYLLGPNFPNVPTTDLAIDATVIPSLIKASTFGRSAWKALLD